LASGVAAINKQGQVIFSILKALKSELSATDHLTTQAAGNYLGLTASAVDTVAALGSFFRTFTINTLWLKNFKSRTIAKIPSASSGTYSAGGELPLTSVFPNAAKISASANTSGAGVVISSSVINSYGGPVHGSLVLANDCRDWFYGLLLGMVKIATVRATGTTSAITAANLSRSLVVGTVLPTIPTAATAATNPTTGIPSDTFSLGLEQLIVSIAVNFSVADDETSGVLVA
jgi:hypothetical protein